MKNVKKGLFYSSLIVAGLLVVGCNTTAKDIIENDLQVDKKSLDEVLKEKYIIINQGSDYKTCNDAAVEGLGNHMMVDKVIYTQVSGKKSCEDFDREENKNCIVKKDDSVNKDSCILGVNKLEGAGETPKDEVIVPKDAKPDKKRWYLVVTNVDPELCSLVFIDQLAKDQGFDDVSFYKSDSQESCDNIRTQADGKVTIPAGEDGCKEYDVSEHTDDYPNADGNATCVVGTYTEPKKD